MYSRDELFLHSLECYFGVYFPRCFATREINTKITLSLVSAETIRHSSTYIIIYVYEYIMALQYVTQTSIHNIK